MPCAINSRCPRPHGSAIGIQFCDLTVLRRAFVHPAYAERPHATVQSVGRSLARMGTLGAQRQRHLKDSLRRKGLRNLLARMEKVHAAHCEVRNAVGCGRGGPCDCRCTRPLAIWSRVSRLRCHSCRLRRMP